jgi:hypothetical protein
VQKYAAENVEDHMQERLIDALRRDRTCSASDVPDRGEQRRSMKIELLLGGVLIPGFIEYHAGDDQVTFTIKHLSHATPGEV